MTHKMTLIAGLLLLLAGCSSAPVQMDNEEPAMHQAKDYINDNIRCNCISPARVHTPFVDEFIKKNYPGKEEQMFEKLSKTQPIGRMGKPQEIADLALYLSSDEARFITGSNFPIDGGFITLNSN